MSKQPGTLRGSPSIKVIKSKRVFTEEEKKEIGRWIEEVIGENLDLHDLLLSLRSGTKLCKLINRLQPVVVDEGRITYESTSPAFEENLKLYLAACFQLGVRSHELFTVDDVLNNGDLQALLRNVVAVYKASVGRGYAGPKLNISEQDENELERVWAEVASLKKALQECLEDNNSLRVENKEIKEYLAKQDSEVSKLKIKIQSVERSQAAPRAANAAGEDEEAAEAPAVVYVIKKKKKTIGRENTERSPKLTTGLRSVTSLFKSSKSSPAIYGDDEHPREQSAVIELTETGEKPPTSPGRESTLVLVNKPRKKSSAKKKPARKGALGNPNNDQVFFTSLSGVVF